MPARDNLDRELLYDWSCRRGVPVGSGLWILEPAGEDVTDAGWAATTPGYR
ncbi:hypothetical protein GCM10017667_39290 [Streptomyces filamentosus]|uniref:Uncharacterized protein n=1 Tax=Streptomyces filamentosus TaxID=67294 RepID=A0A919BPN0_STRFL|nr:hypothetical protein GCM10017667_39290 [Streptomyces filamentosus]